MTSLLASPIESEPGVGYFMFGFVGLQQTIDDYERIASFSSWPRGRATKTGTPFREIAGTPVRDTHTS